MRVDPSRLRGSYSVGLAAILVVGTISLIGMASVGPVKYASSSNDSFRNNGSQKSSTVVLNPQPLYPGARVAVFLHRGTGSAPMLLVESATVRMANRRSVALDVTPTQNELITFARVLGELRYIQIAKSGPSPYAGEGVKDIAELKKVLQASH